MNSLGKILGWTCISGALFWGCFTSTITEATDGWSGKANELSVQAVVLEDSTRIEFDRPPSFFADTLRGDVAGEPVSIPVCEVATYRSEELSVVGTICVVVGSASIAAGLFYAYVASTFSGF